MKKSTIDLYIMNIYYISYFLLRTVLFSYDAAGGNANLVN